MSSSPLIQFDRVSLGYGRRTVLDGISLSIETGDYLGIVGPNGSGKTTLIKCLLGLLRPQRGRVLWEGVPSHRQLRFGYVPQRQNVDELYPFTLLDMALMGRFGRLGLGRRPGRKDREAAISALLAVGLADKAGDLYRDLSGGQKQRSLIAGALAGDPQVLVLDEPTNGMDLGSEAALMDLIGDLHGRGNLTVIFVTHLLNLVANSAREIVILNDRFLVGPRAQVLTSETLTALYERPVAIGTVSGKSVIVPETVEVSREDDRPATRKEAQ
ncbi:MAG: metal ABC transporter ATP-binding protein [Armatimonadetes bacterium]|nr:metal ABC transporter ATP-binding protein [Armatimonadota bacterium]